MDHKKLRELAEAALWTGNWYDAGCNSVMCAYPETGQFKGEFDEIAHPVPLGITSFMAAAQPSAVIALLDEIEALRKQFEVLDAPPSCEQAWALVGSPVAYHLIERHAEDWNDAGRMMDAWRAATTAPLRADAERYRWLRDKMGFSQAPGKPTVMSLCGSIPAPNHEIHFDWAEERFDASVDATVDAAMKDQPA